MTNKKEMIFSYQDPNFIDSKEGRLFRVLSEYEYPNIKFKKEGIENMIVFFGSARAPSPAEASAISKKNPNDPLLRLAPYFIATEELAKKIAIWIKDTYKDDRYAICSGGGPGIMLAANKGAYEGGAKSVGLTINLPFENIDNPYITEGLNFNFKYFFLRKFMFAYRSEALIVMPGGFGTLDELFEILTLMQTRKIKRNFPIVMFGKEYWTNLLNVDVLKDYGTINSKDLESIFMTDSVDEAFDYVTTNLISAST